MLPDANSGLTNGINGRNLTKRIEEDEEGGLGKRREGGVDKSTGENDVCGRPGNPATINGELIGEEEEELASIG